jgi:hypothetical protein
MKTKVHRVVLLIVDTDNIGADEVREVLENTKYPNHCIGPQVMGIETVNVEWSDDHPLNRRESQREAFDRLFATSRASGGVE